ncbi:DUF2922 domain-containing protein [Dethiothermospora halolimnae]|uniref:DUF2922 domain-containing protein n=1 Tax=Dethiothermospora halolimnae TaxID=3114390 RepID=UPI003CCBCAD1
MADKRLEMTFKNEADKRTTISIDNPRDDITDAEVQTAMNDIIAKNIFNSSGGNLVGIYKARIVTTAVEELTV